METSIVQALLYKKDNYSILKGESETEILKLCADYLNSGIKIIQFNGMNYDSESIKVGYKIRQLCSIFDSLYIFKSRCDIANLTNANGVLLDNQGLSVLDARKLINHDMIVGSNYIDNNSDFIILDCITDIHANINNLFIKSNENIYIRKA